MKVSENIQEIAFSKLHGLGNDFIVLDRRHLASDIDAESARRLCDRHFGIGADGVLVLLPSDKALAKMVIHNADGSVPEMCGNGLRCAVKYLADAALQKPTEMQVETGAGVLACTLRYEKGEVAEVEISMGPARWGAPNLPSSDASQPFLQKSLPGLPQQLGSAVSMGNPHLVLLDAPLEKAGEWGPGLETCPGFREKTNVEFVRFADEGLEVVVWERGVGLTLACGTGACAAVAVATRLGRLSVGTWVRVKLPGGFLSIHVSPDFQDVRLRGPVTFVFQGLWRL